MGLPNQLNTISKGYFCLYGIVVFFAWFFEFDKMQILSENCANVLAVSVGLATIGVCVFGGVDFGWRPFLFSPIDKHFKERKMKAFKKSILVVLAIAVLLSMLACFSSCGDWEDADTSGTQSVQGDQASPDGDNSATPEGGEGNTPEGGEGNTPEGGEDSTPEGGEGNMPEGGEGNTPDGGEDNIPNEDYEASDPADFTYTETADGIEITKYVGNDTEVYIPKYIDGKPVTSIGEYAFEDCTGLTSVTIGNGVTSIGEGAFINCTGLTSVTIGNGVTSIGSWAFWGCSGLTSITVAQGNTKYHSAGNCLIETESKTLVVGCKNSIIPNDGRVTSIGDRAFINCTGLTSITIPDSVTSIGGGAFYDCTGLTSVTIGNSVTSIGDAAFGNCTGLTSITIPDSVTVIGWEAFAGCSGLTSITIPDSVTSIGDSFKGCDNLTYNQYDNAYYFGNGVNPYVVLVEAISEDITSVNIHENTKFIYNSAFSGCTGLTSITIPNSVTSIGSHAFYNCTGLTSITISNSVTSIGVSAFYNCTGLTSITISDSVTSIDSYAFEGCTGLTSINIPDSVTSIGYNAFYYCTGLTEIVIPDSVTSIGNYAFDYCRNLTSIKYRGTEEQWNAIIKGSNWDYNTGDYTITYNYQGE